MCVYVCNLLGKADPRGSLHAQGHRQAGPHSSSLSSPRPPQPGDRSDVESSRATGDDGTSESVRIGFGFPFSRVQSRVSAKFTGGRTGEAVVGKILCY